jgi:hypothetical protein
MSSTQILIEVKVVEPHLEVDTKVRMVDIINDALPSHGVKPT